MAIDRDATLKAAEKLLRQGKLDGAIEQYVRLVEEQPRDWNSINALGDLYVRAGDTDRAVAQFVRIADFLYGEGFFPKAAALYKKALKVRSDHEHTLLRLSDIAVQQGLLADAKLYLRQLAQQRRDRGDKRGAAECLVRLGTIDDGDADAKVAAARAAQALGDTAQAVTLLQDAADAYDKQKRAPQALEALTEAAALAPADGGLRARVARALVAAGQMERAQEFLTVDTAGDDPDLLLAVGRMELAAGRSAEGRAILMRVIALASDRHTAIAALAEELLAAGRVDDAYACVEVLVDAALFEAEFERAATVLETFLGRQRTIPALMKLVEVCVDAGFDARMAVAQGQLADAYLDEGRAAEARIIAEDLIAREPGVEIHVKRLRRALDLLGVEDADQVIAQQLNSEPLFDEPLDFSDLHAGDAAIAAPEITAPPSDVSVEPPLVERRVADIQVKVTPAPEQPPIDAPPARPARQEIASEDLVFDLSEFTPPPGPTESAGRADAPAPPLSEAFEVDLSDTISSIHKVLAPVPSSVPPADPPPPAAVEPAPDLDAVFQQMRDRATRDNQAGAAAELFERAQEHLRRGRAAEAAADLQAAARVPQMRFKAAAQLGRLSVSRGDLRGGVEWFERAAEAPSTSPEETFAVLYDLADALERMGESARALAVLMEIETDAAGYRDVRERIDQLTRGRASAGFNGDRP